MIVIDPGHEFDLAFLDDDPLNISAPNRLTFVKREGEGYPGNVGHHAGTTIQEVCRALISRLQYLDGQILCTENEYAQAHLRAVIVQMESRAAKRHGREFHVDPRVIETYPTCEKCLHIGCGGECHP